MLKDTTLEALEQKTSIYGLKLLFGSTSVLGKKKKTYTPYLDTYAGVGIRYRELTYQTTNGYVNDVYFNYKREKLYETRPTPHLGFRLGWQRNVLK